MADISNLRVNELFTYLGYPVDQDTVPPGFSRGRKNDLDPTIQAVFYRLIGGTKHEKIQFLDPNVAEEYARKFLDEEGRAQRYWPSRGTGMINWLENDKQITEALKHLFIRKQLSNYTKSYASQQNRSSAKSLKPAEETTAEDTEDERPKKKARHSEVPIPSWSNSQEPDEPETRACIDYIRTLNPRHGSTTISRNWLHSLRPEWTESMDCRLQLFMHDWDFYIVIDSGDDIPTGLCADFKKGTEIEVLDSEEAPKLHRRLSERICELTLRLARNPPFVLAFQKHGGNAEKTERSKRMWKRSKEWWNPPKPKLRKVLKSPELATFPNLRIDWNTDGPAGRQQNTQTNGDTTVLSSPRSSLSPPRSELEDTIEAQRNISREPSIPRAGNTFTSETIKQEQEVSSNPGAAIFQNTAATKLKGEGTNICPIILDDETVIVDSSAQSRPISKEKKRHPNIQKRQKRPDSQNRAMRIRKRLRLMLVNSEQGRVFLRSYKDFSEVQSYDFLEQLTRFFYSVQRKMNDVPPIHIRECINRLNDSIIKRLLSGTVHKCRTSLASYDRVGLNSGDIKEASESLAEPTRMLQISEEQRLHYQVQYGLSGLLEGGPDYERNFPQFPVPAFNRSKIIVNGAGEKCSDEASLPDQGQGFSKIPRRQSQTEGLPEAKANVPSPLRQAPLPVDTPSIDSSGIESIQPVTTKIGDLLPKVPVAAPTAWNTPISPKSSRAFGASAGRTSTYPNLSSPITHGPSSSKVLSLAPLPYQSKPSDNIAATTQQTGRTERIETTNSMEEHDDTANSQQISPAAQLDTPSSPSQITKATDLPSSSISEPRRTGAYSSVPDQAPFSTKPSAADIAALSQTPIPKPLPPASRMCSEMALYTGELTSKTLILHMEGRDGRPDLKHAYRFDNYMKSSTLDEFCEFASRVCELPLQQMKGLKFVPGFGASVDYPVDRVAGKVEWEWLQEYLPRFFEIEKRNSKPEKMAFAVLVNVVREDN